MSIDLRRGLLATAICFSWVEAYLIGAKHSTCNDVLSAAVASIVLQILVISIGLCVVVLSCTAGLLSALPSVSWRRGTLGVLAAAALMSLLLASLETNPVSKSWIAAPIVGGIALCAATVIVVRRLTLGASAILGVTIAALLCAAIYTLTPYSGSGPCGFTP
ncbi:MAG: hypothetical protein KGN02_06635 [bacterium]|nr:hypothetical protein [bacterium]